MQGVAFFALFALGTLLYAFLTVRSRRWFLVTGVLFGLFEGASRAMSRADRLSRRMGWPAAERHQERHVGSLALQVPASCVGPTSAHADCAAEIICLTFAPAFASAAIYGIVRCHRTVIAR